MLDAISILNADGYDDAKAKQVIADRMRDGRYRVKAGIYAEGPALFPLSWDRPASLPAGMFKSNKYSKPEYDKIVDREVFLRSADWQKDYSTWTWYNGNVAVQRTGARSSRIRIQMWNVRLDIPQLIKPVPEIDAKPQVREMVSRAGVKRGPDWPEWVASLTDLVDNNSIPSGISGMRLNDLINDHLPEGAKGQHYGSVETTLAAVLRRMGER